MDRWAATVDRPLPWRGERDAYRVLVSEVMLQQTQASRVAKAYPVFLRRFPDAARLAAASSSDVISAWGGLGYNRRALALWRACRAAADLGEMPRSVEGLERLPGVGPYTARAVASFAFGVHVGVVDANVRRVLTRFHGLPSDASMKQLQTIADELVPRGRSGAWNQAMIDLGALVCRARTPSCDGCPLGPRCAWRAGRRPPARAARPRAEPVFASTQRFVRGRIVAELRRRRRATDVRTLRAAVDVAAPRFDAALASLVRDGIVSRAKRVVALGSGASGRGRAASRRPGRGTASRRG